MQEEVLELTRRHCIHILLMSFPSWGIGGGHTTSRLGPFLSFQTALFPQVSQVQPVCKQRENSLTENASPFSILQPGVTHLVTILLYNSIICVPKSTERYQIKKSTRVKHKNSTNKLKTEHKTYHYRSSNRYTIIFSPDGPCNSQGAEQHFAHHHNVAAVFSSEGVQPPVAEHFQEVSMIQAEELQETLKW